MCTLDYMHLRRSNVVNLVILTSTVFGTQWTGNILNGQVVKEGLVLENKDLVYIIYDFYESFCKKVVVHEIIHLFY